MSIWERIKLTIYLRKADGIGWYVGADELERETFYFTRWGALRAANKWYEIVDRTPFPRVYLEREK